MDKPQSTMHKKRVPAYRPFDSGLKSLSALSNNPDTNTGSSSYGGKFYCLEKSSQRNLMQVVDAFHQHSVDGLVSEIIHELNQPLTAISLLSETVRRMIVADKYELHDVEHSLKSIDLQAKRAGDVIKGLRRFSADHALEKETISMNTIIHEVIELIEIEAIWNHVSMVVELAEESVELDVDRVLMEQVILNLARNAIEAMKTVNRKQRKLYISTRHIDGGVMVSVRDTGVGMTLEQTTQAFNAFYSSKPGGMGMGLVISRSIVKAHGGDIHVSSSLGDGSKFYFMLEAKEKELTSHGT